ncbi:MAG: hypothetical protein NTU60_11260 [Candidatus Aminicenantes bacterium]|nr:hypothetical protein [Candidatus Aminicenantes bacterium]
MKQKGTPNLPFHFKRLATFLENAKVSPAQKKELDLARNALKGIFETVYGTGDDFMCTAEHPRISPIRF